MIYIRYGEADKQNVNDYSAFLSFNYNPDYVQEIKKLPCRFWNPDRKEWEIPINLVPMVKKFENNITELNQAPMFAPASKVNVEDLKFKTPSFPHQLEGVKYGIEHNNFLLGDQQGLGKTKQMVDLAVYKKQHNGLKHCLIICGVNNLKYNWLDEIKKHSDETGKVIGFTKPGKEPTMAERIEDLSKEPEEFFWITNIETLRCHKEGRFYKSEIVDIINDFIKKDILGLIIVDEIHKAKNPTSMQGRGLLKIKGCQKIGLSGTLLVNKPMDLFMPLSFIQALTMNYYQFLHRYTVQDIWGTPIGYQNMGELQELMNNNMLRRTKELLDLPEKIYQPIYLEMSNDERRLYNEILTATKKECDKISNPTLVLPKLTRMRQVLCHTGLVSTQVIKSTKFEKLRDILEEAQINGEKVIVFSMFRELIEMALKEFQDMKPLHIWGSMNQVELNNQKDAFQNTPGFQVLFGQTMAAGTGHTLNEASIVVFLDLPWNKATMEQAEDRAHRIGTKHTVTVISLLMKDSYDELLNKMIIEKASFGDILVDGKDSKEFRRFIRCIFKEESYDENIT